VRLEVEVPNLDKEKGGKGQKRVNQVKKSESLTVVSRFSRGGLREEGERRSATASLPTSRFKVAVCGPDVEGSAHNPSLRSRARSSRCDT